MLFLVAVAPVESQIYRLDLGLLTEISLLEKRTRFIADIVKQKNI